MANKSTTVEAIFDGDNSVQSELHVTFIHEQESQPAAIFLDRSLLVLFDDNLRKDGKSTRALKYGSFCWVANSITKKCVLMQVLQISPSRPKQNANAIQNRQICELSCSGANSLNIISADGNCMVLLKFFGRDDLLPAEILVLEVGFTTQPSSSIKQLDFSKHLPASRDETLPSERSIVRTARERLAGGAASAGMVAAATVGGRRWTFTVCEVVLRENAPQHSAVSAGPRSFVAGLCDAKTAFRVSLRPRPPPPRFRAPGADGGQQPEQAGDPEAGAGRGGWREWAAAAREWVGGVDEELERLLAAIHTALLPDSPAASERGVTGARTGAGAGSRQAVPAVCVAHDRSGVWTAATRTVPAGPVVSESLGSRGREEPRPGQLGRAWHPSRREAAAVKSRGRASWAGPGIRVKASRIRDEVPSQAAPRM